MRPKFIAFYLPQYHTIPENDEWWGKGFTEWMRVKNARPLFKEHQQPRIPYDNYDLSDVNVMRKQSSLAKEYGLFGFCYYHYWFKGKLLLERPLEQMLDDKAVDLPFCLSWANEPWTRAWDGNSKITLMPQDYGDEADWLKHINYLLPFFKDSRYIKVDDKPLFLIYRTESFNYFDKMFQIWGEYLKQNGLKGIYIAEMLTSYQKKPVCKQSKAVVEFEPMFTTNLNMSKLAKLRNILLRKTPWLFFKKYRTKDYDKIWNNILSRPGIYPGKTVYLGAFPDWDNTPRFKSNSLVFKNSSPEKFQNYFLKQVMRSQSEFVFINAWNEWAEGAYLEPDKNNNYGFLEAIKSVNTKLKESVS
jgi:hypothetical protein